MTASIISMVLLATIPLLLVGCGPSAEAHYDAGVKLQDQGHTEQAIKEFDEAIRIDPKLSDARVRRGDAYLKAGHFEKARQDYDEAVLMGYQTAQVYNQRGLAYLNNNQHMKAMESFNLANQVGPDFGGAYYNRGLTHYSMVMDNPEDKAQEMVKELDQAIHLAPTREAYVLRAKAYSQLGEWELVVDDLNEAIRLEPGFIGDYMARGDAHEALGQHENAVADYGEAIRLDPQAVRSYTQRSVAHRRLGQVEEAAADAEHAVSLNPLFWKTHRERAIGYVNAGELEQGIAEFDQAIQLKPPHPTHFAYAYISRGDTHRRLGNLEKAIEDLEAALALREVGEAYASRALVYALQGKKSEVKQDIAKAEELGVKEYPAATDLSVLKADFEALKTQL